MTQEFNLLTQALQNHNLDALLISSTPNIAYLTGITHFAVNEREAFVLITPKELFLFTDSRYTGGVKPESGFSIIECGARSSFYELINDQLEKHKIKTLGYEPNSLTVQEYDKLHHVLKNIKLSAVQLIVEKHRMIKTDSEVDKIKKACSLSDKTFSHILPFIKKGVTEQELAAEMEYFIRKNGGEIAFDTIVAFGVNSAVPHHHTGNAKLTKLGTPILIDFGARVEGYNADMTRTVFYGKPSSNLEQQYKAVHFTQNKAYDTLEKGLQDKHEVAAADVALAAEEALHKTGFPKLPHGLGHGVGLEVHEAPSLFPKSKDTLTDGMVFTVEPGIYILGTAGVRIEDTVLIKNHNLEILTRAPKSIIILSTT